MPEHNPPDRVVLTFGRFALVPGERLLTKDGDPMELGGRTLDTLIALASRPNEVVSKRELMAEVWPDVTVEEGSLRFHIAGLRKALGDGKDGARFITTLAGRGYCFVAPVTRSPPMGGGPEVTRSASPRATFLPVRLARMIGRQESVRAIVEELAASRFVSIVGPGGVGKTTVAVAVAHELLPTFGGSVLFVDLSLLSDPRMVAASVASTLGLSVQSDDPAPSLVALLRDQHMLLVLDNCEHVIEHAAHFSTQLLLGAPGLQILATSREALRAEGEQVHRLEPLEVPPDHENLTAEATLSFPAAQLFVERAKASGANLELGDADAAIVGDICRRLEGMALAIELAAGRVEAYGLPQTAALLDERFTLIWPGRRTAPARQKTLRATFDWSYGLLAEAERVVFRRLAIFIGSFTIEAALAVVTNDTVDAAWVFAAIDSLVAKSMVSAIPAGGMMRYRLLDAARAYALDIETDRAERTALAARHVAYCIRLLERFGSDGRPLLDAARRESHLAELNNVRAALEWCFGHEGSVEAGIRLATAAAPVFFAMSLLQECQRWSHRAILALDEDAHGGPQEMRLQAALALSSMWASQDNEVTFAAMNRSIDIAKQRQDPVNQILLMTPLQVFHLISADFNGALKYAEQIVELSKLTDDIEARRLAQILIGYSHHFSGNLPVARFELERSLQSGSNEASESAGAAPSPATMMMSDAMGAPILALASSAAPSALARTLWLQGDPAMALYYVNQTIDRTVSAGHPVTLLVALIYAICVMIWNGDYSDAEIQVSRFISTAKSHKLSSYISLGCCFDGQLSISRGEAKRGVSILEKHLRELNSVNYKMMDTSFKMSFAWALLELGQIEDGLCLINEVIGSVETNGDHCYMPELLRIKANLLLGVRQSKDDLADVCFAQSLQWSQRQGALAWELRTSIDLAKRLADGGAPVRARALQRPVCDRFTKGATTADLRKARGLLAQWG